MEKKRLLDLASGMDRIMLLLLYETGLDVHHLIDLHVSDLDLDSGRLKTAVKGDIPLSVSLLSEIKDYLQSRPGQVYLMEGRCGKPVTSKWKRCILESLRLKAERRQ